MSWSRIICIHRTVPGRGIRLLLASPMVIVDGWVELHAFPCAKRQQDFTNYRLTTYYCRCTPPQLPDGPRLLPFNRCSIAAGRAMLALLTISAVCSDKLLAWTSSATGGGRLAARTSTATWTVGGARRNSVNTLAVSTSLCTRGKLLDSPAKLALADPAHESCPHALPLRVDTRLGPLVHTRMLNAPLDQLTEAEQSHVALARHDLVEIV